MSLLSLATVPVQACGSGRAELAPFLSAPLRHPFAFPCPQQLLPPLLSPRASP